MRTKTLSLIGVLLLASAAVARAQDFSRLGITVSPAAMQPPAAAGVAQTPAAQPAPQATTPKPDVASLNPPTMGRVDFGFRTTSLTGDAARFDRLSDLRDGTFGYLDGFHFKTDNERTLFRADANRVGYRDQQYAVNYRLAGRVKASFDWTQVPLYIGSETRTLFSATGNGVLTVDPVLRQAVQNKTLTLVAAAAQAAPVTIRDRRDIGDAKFTYQASRNLDVNVRVTTTRRNGTNLMSAGFGFGGTVTELPAPVDDRTTDMTTGVEWANQKGLFSVNYDGSWYNQNIPSLTWDNPAAFTSSASLSSQGRLALWPTNDANTVRVNGSVKLPYHSKASAALSYGRWSQNQPLLPNTINPLLSSPLERSTAEARADVTGMVYNFSSRPIANLWLDARDQYYKYDTKTPAFSNVVVNYDSAMGALQETDQLAFHRNAFDVDATYSPYRYFDIGAGYTREDDAQNNRAFGKDATDAARVTFSSTGNQYVTARLRYEYSKRTGSEFDAGFLTDAGEHVNLLRFDIAPRTRNEVLAILTVTPVSVFDVNATVGTGRDNYPDTFYGLRNNNHDSWSIGFDVVPTQAVTVGVNYGYEKFTTLQWSHDALPTSLNATQFFDPTRDWNIDSSDKAKTFSANLDLVKALPKTDIRLSYDRTDGNSAYIYGVVPNSTLPTPTQYNTQPKNRAQVAKADVQYFVRANVAIGAGYWYQEYSVQDPTLDPTLLQPLALGTGFLSSGYAYRPYQGNTGFFHVTYLW